MTVSSTTTKVSYTGNGSTTVFAYTFKIFAEAEIKVYVDNVLKTLTTHYTLSGVGTASGGNVTFVFSNPAASGKACAWTLKWIQDSSDRTITWNGVGGNGVKWAGGSAPDVTSGSGKVDIYTFFTVDGGTLTYGFQAGAEMS